MTLDRVAAERLESEVLGRHLRGTLAALREHFGRIPHQSLWRRSCCVWIQSVARRR
jgi:hypothetical protein